ncbi:MAG: DUF2891 domain-containing protein [Sandaracinus sp.]|nr:DUF2891 domain-containing protein [Sandaracinus sp.]MCB9619584.1 DUF2891 domain-containing protein [Sandaracinus sp.]
MALDGVHLEYPNQIAHFLRSDADLGAPRALTPVFYGCYDWHSAVHGHWLLARAARLFPDAPFTRPALDVLDAITPERVAGEVAYVRERPGFERPYGLAWLLTLQAELVEMGSPHAATLAPLVELGVSHLARWLPKLSFPTRVGTHAQTAFALGLAIDAAPHVDPSLGVLAKARALDFFADDRDYPLHLEPGGEDFLSPSLASADLLRRVLAPSELAAWLDRTMPFGFALPPVTVTDPTDGRLAHLDGLNLSRAWMLEGLASGLPSDDPRVPTLLQSARAHGASALAAIDGAHYAGSHWLGTFACYWLTKRGLT